MLNCAIYPRKSKQVDNSDSMDAQIDMCVRYLNNKYGEGKYNLYIYTNYFQDAQVQRMIHSCQQPDGLILCSTQKVCN